MSPQTKATHMTAGDLAALATEVLRPRGVAERDIALVIGELIENEVAGYASHGILRLVDIVADIDNGKLLPDAKPQLNEKPGGVLCVQGNRALGRLTADFIVSSVLSKAEERPVTVVCLDDAHHIGRLAPIGRKLADSPLHLVTIGFCNFLGRGARVAPPGGRVPLLCTNPLLFALPTSDGPPLVLDMSSSMVSEGTIRDAAQQGREVAEGLLINTEGKTTTNPNGLYDNPATALLLPLGGTLSGHKGFGLALIVETLVGALAGAGNVSAPKAPGNGGLFIVLNPAFFPTGVEGCYERVTEIRGYCRNLGAAGQEARLPGDGAIQQPITASCSIPISQNTIDKLTALRPVKQNKG